MFEPTQLVLYFIVAVLLAVTPGPGLFYVAARTLSGGQSEGIASSLGTGLGGMTHVLAGSFGISALILASADLFTILKYSGAIYLVWLGFRTLKSAYHSDHAVPDLPSSLAGPKRASAFREGFLVEALNPKTAAFFIALIPQFIDPAKASIMAQFIVLGSISVALNTLADILVVFAANQIRTYFVSRPHAIKRLQKLSGVTMIALGLGLAATEAHSS